MQPQTRPLEICFVVFCSTFCTFGCTSLMAPGTNNRGNMAGGTAYTQDAANNESPRGARRGLFGLSSASEASEMPLNTFESSGTQENLAFNETKRRKLPDEEVERRRIRISKTAELVLVEGNKYRTTLQAKHVFQAVLRSLSQSYLLERVDKRNMTLNTDWDKFFIEGRLFRNRFIVSVFAIGPKRTEVSIRNHLEYFSGNAGNSSLQHEGAWLPSPDITDEVTRLVDSVNGQLIPTARRNSYAR